MFFMNQCVKSPYYTCFQRQSFLIVDNSDSFADSLSCLHIIYCFSYSPLLSRLSTVKPAFFASVTDNGLSFIGELNDEIIFRTGFLHAGQFVNGLADSGRFSVNFPPHTAQLPSHNSYS
jgi:hypothetical protein